MYVNYFNTDGTKAGRHNFLALWTKCKCGIRSVLQKDNFNYAAIVFYAKKIPGIETRDVGQKEK
jgi:hypothetical protein